LSRRGAARRPGVRLSGGEHGGRVLPVPKDVRPTEGRVREALFSIWGERLVGARVLDLFAGSGAVALEAVGRGAVSALCVEAAPRVLRALEDNVRRLGEEGVVDVRGGTLPAFLARLAGQDRRFDLAFADPPYRFNAYAEVVAAVASLLAADGELVVEHSSRIELPVEVAAADGSVQVRVDVRKYGESALSFYRRGPK